MLKFKRLMIDGNGKVYRPGQTVPENFSTPAGLAEMVNVGDIEEMVVRDFIVVTEPNVIDTEPLEVETMELSEIEDHQEPIQEPVKKVTTKSRKAGK